MRFGRLIALYEHDERRNGSICWVCQCDCGNETIVVSTKLRIGHTKSCGCYNRDRISETKSTHGMSRTPIYVLWHGIKARCEKESHKMYKYYGGRGIKICNEWQVFENFLKWAENNGYEKGLTIDRIDNDKGYSPDNCRWVTQRENNRNTRANVRCGKGLLVDMKREVAKEAGLKLSQVERRYYYLISKGIDRPAKEHLMNYENTLEKIKHS